MSVKYRVLTSGLFPPGGYMEWSPSLAWQPVPVHTVPQAQDVLLNPGHSACPRLNTMRREVEEGDFIMVPLTPMEDLEEAIAPVLETAGPCPPGAKVTVTGIPPSGVVQYEVTAYADSAGEATTLAGQIGATLDAPWAMGAVSSSVASAAQESGGDVAAALPAGGIVLVDHAPGATSARPVVEVATKGELTLAGAALGESLFNFVLAERGSGFEGVHRWFRFR